jgi:hypothetical protein
MSKLYIRVKKDGFIYDFNDYLARNPECEVVTEEELYPERFLTPAQMLGIQEIKAGRGRKPKAALNLETSEIPEPPEFTPAELAAEASRGMP